MKNKYILKFSILSLSLLGLFAENALAQNKNIVQRSNKPYNQTSNIWGFVDTTNKEYALVGAFNGLSIVDVTNPTTPVEKFFIPGPPSAWREIRTLGRYAYVTTEGGAGVTIVDMRGLPDTIIHKQYTGDGLMTNHIDAIHALHIDNNKLYLYGGNYQGGRAKVFSLANPWFPVYQGTVSNTYVHDGFVSNDTLYSGQIYDGALVIIDATNPLSPSIINTQITPLQFTHNSWMSTDRKIIYTTDEVSGSYVAAYDISDLSNIKEVDRYRHNNSGSIGHNTYVLNNQAATGTNTDWLWTSYYTDGITLVDASRPDNLVEVGNFDSSPTFSGDGFHGAWGVYPYLPSGNILISDIERGLYVVTPTYKRACFLEGVVKDQQTQTPLAAASIKVLNNAALNITTNNAGVFKTGTVDSGYYSLEISHPGYITKTLDSVLLRNGQVTDLQIELSNQPFMAFNLTVRDSAGATIPGAFVKIENASYKYELTASGNGEVSIPVFYLGTYTIYVGKFGFLSNRYDSVALLDPAQIPNVVLASGYADDFFFDFNWTLTSNATSGDWVRAVPIKTTLGGITANPDKDVLTDNGDMCYVTGNAPGSVNTADVDGGPVVLTSPLMDLSSYENPRAYFSRWFSNLSSSSTPNDTFQVFVSNGQSTVLIDQVIGNSVADRGKWVEKSIPLKQFITITNTMRIIVKTADVGTDQITEAGFDNLMIAEDTTSTIGFDNTSSNFFLNAFPNPSNGEFTLQYQNISGDNNATLEVYDVLGKCIAKEVLMNAEGKTSITINQQGLYMVRLQNARGAKTIKIQVQ